MNFQEKFDFYSNLKFRVIEQPDFFVKTKHKEIMASMPNLIKYEKEKEKLQKKAMEMVGIEMIQFYQEPLLSKEQEFHLFNKMNFLKFRVRRLIQNLKSLDEKRMIKIEKLWRKANIIKKHIILANSRLVVLIAKKQTDFKVPGMFEQILSDGNLGLCHAIEYFDIKYGYKFCTYAFRAIKDNIIRGRQKRINKYPITDFDEFERIPDKKELNFEIMDLSDSVKKMLNSLKNERQRKIIMKRFGLNGESSMNLTQIGQELGLSKERIRQVEQQGLEKIRQTFKKERIL